MLKGLPFSRWPTSTATIKKDDQFDIVTLGVGRPNLPSARQMQLSADRRQRAFDRLRVHPRRPGRPRRAVQRDRMDRVLGVALPRDPRRRVPPIPESTSPVFLQLPYKCDRTHGVSRPESTRMANIPRYEDPRGEVRVVPSLAESQTTGPGQVSFFITWQKLRQKCCLKKGMWRNSEMQGTVVYSILRKCIIYKIIVIYYRNY